MAKFPHTHFPPKRRGNSNHCGGFFLIRAKNQPASKVVLSRLWKNKVETSCKSGIERLGCGRVGRCERGRATKNYGDDLTQSPCFFFPVPHDQQPSLTLFCLLSLTCMGEWKSMGSVGVPPFFAFFGVSGPWSTTLAINSSIFLCLDVSAIIRSMGTRDETRVAGLLM